MIPLIFNITCLRDGAKIRRTEKEGEDFSKHLLFRDKDQATYILRPLGVGQRYSHHSIKSLWGGIEALERLKQQSEQNAVTIGSVTEECQNFTLTKIQRDCIVTTNAPVAQVERATDS